MRMRFLCLCMLRFACWQVLLCGRNLSGQTVWLGHVSTGMRLMSVGSSVKFRRYFPNVIVARKGHKYSIFEAGWNE